MRMLRFSVSKLFAWGHIMEEYWLNPYMLDVKIYVFNY